MHVSTNYWDRQGRNRERAFHIPRGIFRLFLPPARTFHILCACFIRFRAWAGTQITATNAIRFTFSIRCAVLHESGLKYRTQLLEKERPYPHTLGTPKICSILHVYVAFPAYFVFKNWRETVRVKVHLCQNPKLFSKVVNFRCTESRHNKRMP